MSGKRRRTETTAGPTGAADPSGVDVATIAALGVLVYALGIGLHEGVHAWMGARVGGAPELLTSTGLRGDWSGVGEVGYLLIGGSGPLVNALLAGVGWAVFRMRPKPGLIRVGAWLLFAVNAWTGCVYLAVSPFGFGDWFTALRNMPNAGLVRASASAAGVVLCVKLFTGTAITLGTLVGNGAEGERRGRAISVTRTAWLAGGAIALAAAALSPLDGLWALAIGAGGSLGTTWPMLLASGRVREWPVRDAPLRVRRSWPTIGLAVVLGVAFVALLGPGIEL